MIYIKSNNVPKKFANIIPQVQEHLSCIREISNHEIRMYCDSITGLVIDLTANKILWEDDLTFSMAIVMCRLRCLKEYWSYEKGIIKINNHDDVIRYLELKKKFKYE